MKKNDIFTIAIVVIVALTASFFISRSLVNRAGGRDQTAPVVDPIDNKFPLPDAKYFNCNSINPSRKTANLTGDATCTATNQPQTEQTQTNEEE